ncbi:MAG: hypothetical protein MPL62_16505, partial [Alphaproteobacteria bacterium]|nr:hypothetical protein [Alphaproteobacteria bacterium]
MQFAKNFLKLAAVALPLLFVATAARAQDREAALAMPGSTTPISTFDIAQLVADGSGNRVFELDLIAKSNSTAATGETGYALELFLVEAELEVSAYSNIIAPITAGPSPVARVAIAEADTLGGLDYTHKYSLGFIATSGLPGWVSGEWQRLMTLEFTYKKAGGDVTVHFKAAASSTAETFNGATVSSGSDGSTSPDLTITGPEVPQNANLTLAFGTDGAGAGLPADHKASAERATQDQGAAGTSIEVTCNLTDNDG